jgi:hypothetical protein
MRDLDEDVKDLATEMAHDRPVTFDETAAELFARWTFKTALVADQINPCPVLPAEAAFALRKSGAVMPGVLIWAARTDPRPQSAGLFTASETFWERATNEDGTTEHRGYAKTPNVFLFLSHVGHLVTVVCAALRDLPPRWQPTGARRTHLMMPLLPFPGRLDWPPRDAIPAEKLMLFAHTFI